MSKTTTLLRETKDWAKTSPQQAHLWSCRTWVVIGDDGGVVETESWRTLLLGFGGRDIL
jgi:hypothetical protein